MGIDSPREEPNFQHKFSRALHRYIRQASHCRGHSVLQFFSLSETDTNLNIILKMKCSMMLALFAAILVAVCALPFDHKVRRPPPRGGVSFPGYGSFNPRGRRSPFDGRVKVDQHIGKDPDVQVDITHQIYEGRNGHVEVYGSASKRPSEQAHADAGIRGEITFGD